VIGALRRGAVWPPSAGSRLTAHGSRPEDVEARVGPGFRPAAAAAADRYAGAWFAAATTIALVVVFSLAHRKADRYIFPAYFSAAALGGVYAIRRAPRFARVADALDRPWLPPALHVGLVLLRLITRGALPEFTFWRS
jgi:hypothetical protein